MNDRPDRVFKSQLKRLLLGQVPEKRRPPESKNGNSHIICRDTILAGSKLCRHWNTKIITDVVVGSAFYYILK